MVDVKQYSVSAIKSARGSEYNGDQVASVLLISEYRLRNAMSRHLTHQDKLLSNAQPWYFSGILLQEKLLHE